MIRVVCKDDLEVVIDPEDIREVCPPVLTRFLGLAGGFAEPHRDEQGRLTFVKDFEIDRHEFVECITFLRSENITSTVERLMHTFNVLGGCARLDTLYEMKKEHDEQHAKMCEENPTTPGEDIHHEYTWKAAVSVRDHSEDGWSCMSRVPRTLSEYWYRKPI